MLRPTSWTDKQEQIVIKMLTEGALTSAIIEATGLRKGQILGYSNRRGYSLLKTQQANRKVKLLEARPAISAQRERKRIIPEEPIKLRYSSKNIKREGSKNPLPLLELKHDMCRWVQADGLFCAAVTIEKFNRITSYCKAHYRRVYRPVNPK